MLASFEKHISQLLDHKTIYLAISGGVDSVVLLDLLMKCQYEPILLHCNFQLRGKESDDDEQFIETLALTYSAPVKIKQFDTNSFAKENGLSIQEAARELRYEWFKEETKNGYLLTAHHLNDQIETFFINLLRGTGLKGLTGISEKRDNIVRPLLNFSKDEILAYARENQLKWREDSSNNKTDYLRNKIRLELYPLMEKYTENLTEKFKSTIEELKLSEEFISQSVHKNIIVETDEQAWFISHDNLKSLVDIELLHILKSFNISRPQICEFKCFLKSENGALFLTNGFEFLKTKSGLNIRKIKTHKTKVYKDILTIDSLIKLRINGYYFKLNPALKINPTIQQIDVDKLVFPIIIRNYKNGDRFAPLGMKGTKLVSDYLKDNGVNIWEKEKVLVLEDYNGEIPIIFGYGISEKYKLNSTTKTVLEIIKIDLNT